MSAPLLAIAPVLAWRPFIDPIDAHTWWYVLIIPLAFFICVAYKGVRAKDLHRYWVQVLIMTAQVVLGMIALAVISFLLVEVFVKWATK